LQHCCSGSRYAPAARPWPARRRLPRERRSRPPCRLFEVEASCKPATHFASGAPTACREIARRRAERRPLGDRLEATVAVLERYRAATCAAHAAARTAAAGVPAWARGATEEDKARIAGETGVLTALQYMRDGY
jgi:hypothetical protein